MAGRPVADQPQGEAPEAIAFGGFCSTDQEASCGTMIAILIQLASSRLTVLPSAPWLFKRSANSARNKSNASMMRSSASE